LGTEQQMLWVIIFSTSFQELIDIQDIYAFSLPHTYVWVPGQLHRISVKS